jgi:nucleotide-binding universal stress UspA family protein
MPFRNVLVAVDGSEYSQVASKYAFWLSNELDADLTGQHVVDPRIVDVFISPEFGEALGYAQAADTEEKVFRAVEKIGRVILDLFKKEAKENGIEASTFLDVGHIVEEVAKRSDKYDLLIVGHRGKGSKRSASHLMTGSVAERLVVDANIPVLVAVQPLSEIKQFLVAFDGSEASRGALLAAERLALETRKELRAITVVSNEDARAEAHLLAEEGEKFLREYHEKDIFRIIEGSHADSLIEQASLNDSLLVLGAYGHNRREDAMLGSTALKVIRKTRSSTLILK